MQLCIHLGTNLEYFKLLNAGFLLSQGKQDKEIGQFFASNFPGELANNISPQYEVNMNALKEIRRKFGADCFAKISGIYYGSDNCEYLVPTKSEIIQALELFAEFNKIYPPHMVRYFTFVTPYVGEKMLQRLEESLSYLHDLSIKNPIEIVVNDFGVLNVITKKYPKLKISFGRVIHKLLKTPLIDTFGYNVHPSGESIKNKSAQEQEILKQEIIKWQLKFYNSSEFGLEGYRVFLEKHGLKRVAFDYMEKRENLYKNLAHLQQNHALGVDIYYPWALIFTGRLCDTSAIENPRRGWYAIDDICPRSCDRYDVSYKIKTVGYHMIQRGNAGYRSELNLDYLHDDVVNNENNRLVFAPFVSV